MRAFLRISLLTAGVLLRRPPPRRGPSGSPSRSRRHWPRWRRQGASRRRPPSSSSERTGRRVPVPRGAAWMPRVARCSSRRTTRSCLLPDGSPDLGTVRSAEAAAAAASSTRISSSCRCRTAAAAPEARRALQTSRRRSPASAAAPNRRHVRSAARVPPDHRALGAQPALLAAPPALYLVRPARRPGAPAFRVCARHDSASYDASLTGTPSSRTWCDEPVRRRVGRRVARPGAERAVFLILGAGRGRLPNREPSGPNCLRWWRMLATPIVSVILRRTKTRPSAARTSSKAVVTAMGAPSFSTGRTRRTSGPSENSSIRSATTLFLTNGATPFR